MAGKSADTQSGWVDAGKETYFDADLPTVESIEMEVGLVLRAVAVLGTRAGDGVNGILVFVCCPRRLAAAARFRSSSLGPCENGHAHPLP